MRKFILALFCAAFFGISYAQNNSEIANVYIKRANSAISESTDYKIALSLFEKAMKYMDTVTDSNVADLGARIYFEVKDFTTAQKYSKQYFLVAKDSKSEAYLKQLELFIDIGEELELQKEKERILEEIRLKEEKELKRIDSLKVVWQNSAIKLSVKVDSIYQFNANNFALYRKDDKFGIINDKAELIVPADVFTSSVSYEGFILLKNAEINPTKIYYYNTYNSTGALLPAPSVFNKLSTHFGKVMLPRADGRLVLYPNNSYEPMVYDLNEAKIVRIGNNKEEVLKNLKKKGVIRKYDKDGEVKIGKEWYFFGGHLGGGIHPLYLENDYKVHAFLCSIDGTILYSNSAFDFIGAFYENRAQAIKGDKISWINVNGTRIIEVKDKMNKYEGNSKVFKLEEGIYQIRKDGIIVKGDETLEKMSDYLRRFQ